MERTLAIIKPDAVANRCAGRMIARIEEEGFRIVALRLTRLTREQAEGFYAVHRERPFFNDLTVFMSSGACIVLVLEREQAIRQWRSVMGATDPGQAEAGSLRKQFARQHGAGLADPIELLEDSYFDVHLLEHRLDHNIDILELAERQPARHKVATLGHLFLGKPALGHRSLVIATHSGEPLGERFLGSLDQVNRYAGVRKAHGDAAAHGARPDHARLRDRPSDEALGETRDLGRGALGEEGVNQGLRLG